MGAPLTQYMAMETVRTEARILCLDSDQAHLQDMRSILADNGYQSECTLTPGRALEVMAVTRPDVILTEIEFAELEGFEVLRALRRIDPGAVIVVITSKEREPNPDRPLGLIFEYIEKPATPAVLLSHLRKAVAFAHEKRRMLGIGAHSNEDRLRSKLEWLIWKEKRQMSSRNASETLLLKNIKHSMSQGLGFGGMLTQIELLEMMAKKEGGNITIPAQAFETLLAASLDMREWLDKLDHVVDVLGRRFGTAAMSGDDFTTGITESLAAVERFRKIKNQTIISADIDFPHDISCSKEVFCFALRELLTNAFKYSPENSNIHLMKFRTGHDVTISIINDI
ncbi:MAG: response regulator, partial [Spirochaetia bacterium]|nr:response regulator [Spirochaetia bacterium]